MPVTISYDLENVPNNDRTYIRSALERFGWKRLGGSTFRYPADPGADEDWLNHVIPSLMFLRSFLVGRGHQLKFFTIDAHGVSLIDQNDPFLIAGFPPVKSEYIRFSEPTNVQSALKALKEFVDGADAKAGAV